MSQWQSSKSLTHTPEFIHKVRTEDSGISTWGMGLTYQGQPSIQHLWNTQWESLMWFWWGQVFNDLTWLEGRWLHQLGSFIPFVVASVCVALSPRRLVSFQRRQTKYAVLLNGTKRSPRRWCFVWVECWLTESWLKLGGVDNNQFHDKGPHTFNGKEARMESTDKPLSPNLESPQRYIQTLFCSFKLWKTMWTCKSALWWPGVVSHFCETRCQAWKQSCSCSCRTSHSYCPAWGCYEPTPS